MANIISVMIKNKPYDGTRLTIVGSQSSNQYFHYSEASGTRYMVNPISSTAAPQIESVTFDAFLSFTSSGAQVWEFSLVPMNIGETCIIDMDILGLKSDGSKGYVSKSYGAYRHSGSALVQIGTGMTYSTMTDFTSVSHYFTASATASINLIISGETSQNIDFDLHLHYKKGYHTLLSGGGVYEPPWFPPPTA